MRAMGTNSSAFTGCIGLGGYLFGFAGLARQGGKPAILICNQGVGGSSPSGGTTLFNDLSAVIRDYRITAVPIKGTSAIRCASVPRVPTAQHHHKADPNHAASLPFLHCRRNETETNRHG